MRCSTWAGYLVMSCCVMAYRLEPTFPRWTTGAESGLDWVIHSPQWNSLHLNAPDPFVRLASNTQGFRPKGYYHAIIYNIYKIYI